MASWSEFIVRWIIISFVTGIFLAIVLVGVFGSFTPSWCFDLNPPLPVECIPPTPNEMIVEGLQGFPIFFGIGFVFSLLPLLFSERFMRKTS